MSETEQQSHTCVHCGTNFEDDKKNDNPTCPECGKQQASGTFPGGT